MPVMTPASSGPLAGHGGGSRSAALALIVFFIACIGVPSVVQVVHELREGQRPRVVDLVRYLPTATNLRRYEQRLEDENRWVRHLRPWVQWARLTFLRDGGDKVLLGPTGWWFYKPGVEYVTQRSREASLDRELAAPLRAIRDFRDQLSARGIELVLLPVPNKESIYPDRLLRSRNPGARSTGDLPSLASSLRPLSPLTARLLEVLRGDGFHVVDLFETLGAARKVVTDDEPLYLAQDSHWSPAGIEWAARAVGEYLRRLGLELPPAARMEERKATVARHGDLVAMLRSPAIERSVPPEVVHCRQVVMPPSGSANGERGADILVLGDSFVRIFERDEPGSAGFVAHLVREMRQPVDMLVSDGGASTLVRQELFRRPALLTGKRVVLWEFVERDLRFGTEGWQPVPLPPIPSTPPESTPGHQPLP